MTHERGTANRSHKENVMRQWTAVVLLGSLLAGCQAMLPDSDGRPPEVIDRSLEWLRAEVAEDDGRPLFLFMHLFDVHDPYTPPAPFDERFGPDYEGPIDGREITVRFSNGTVFINDLAISQVDAPARNGLIHVLEGVLIPAPRPPACSAAGMIRN